MKFQVLCFFFLIGIVLSCCIQEFLRFLYRYGVSWNHSFRNLVTYKNSTYLQETEQNTDLPQQLRDLDIQAYFLNNFGIAFIIHLIIFAVYLLLLL